MMLRHKHDAIVLRIRILTFAILVEQILVFTPALVFQYQGDYRKFNIIVSAQFGFIAIYALAWLVAFRYYSRLLFQKLDALLSSSSHQSRAEKHQSKLGNFGNAEMIENHRKRLGL